MSAHQSDFRNSMAARFRMERAQRQLTAARSICKRLDLAKSLEKPVDEAFWPPDELTAKLLAQSEVIRREVCRSDDRRYRGGKRAKGHENHDFGPNAKSDDSDLDEFEEPRGEYDTVLGRESDEEEYCDIDAAQHGTVEARVSLRFVLSISERKPIGLDLVW